MRNLDNYPLRRFEDNAAAAARDAFAERDEHVTDPVWGDWAGPICETLGSAADYLARVAGADSAHYALEKATNLARQSHQLLAQLWAPAMWCPHDIPIVDEDGDTVLHGCGLRAGHRGDCALVPSSAHGRAREGVANSADNMLMFALDLAVLLWHALGTDVVEDDDIREHIANLRTAINCVEILLPAAVDLVEVHE